MLRRLLLLAPILVVGAGCAFFPLGDDGDGDDDDDAAGEGEGEGEAGCGIVPIDYDCVEGALVCRDVAPDGRCRVTEDEACVDGPTCLTACGGASVDAECVENAPGIGREARCPADSVAVDTCACATKCDCEPGLICSENLCALPPASCGGSGDCPRGPDGDLDRCEYFACNGFIDRCFAPNPLVCVDDDDCAGACLSSSCVCSAAGDCLPGAACTVADEAEVCGPGLFCDDDGRCQTLPPCSAADDFCSASGLVCNVVAGRCERPTACATSESCLATDYCDDVSGICRSGCRDDAGCAVDERCVEHDCVPVAGTGAFGELCVDENECDAPLICSALSGTCAEVCATADDCVACAELNGTCSCNGLGLCTP